MFPTKALALDNGWLTRALRDAGALGDAVVTEFRCERSGLREAIATRVVRLRLCYDRVESGAPATLIVKFATDCAAQRHVLNVVGGYERETRVYRELGAELGLPAPKCYAAEFDRASSAYVLLLEDLAPAAPGDFAHGLPLEHIELAIRELARFHATWWNSERLETFPWLWPAKEQRSSLRELFLASLSKCESELAARSPQLFRAASQLARFAQKSTFGEVRLRPPLTLVHGDLHVGNLFFPSPAGRFAVVDWQTARMAESGATDLARLIVSGLSSERRRAHERRLIRIYLEALSLHGVADFGLAELKARYRQGLFEQVFGQVILMATLEQPSELVELQRQRIEAAVFDAELGKVEAAT